MDRHVVLPPRLCKVTWIVTHKIATKICITQQDLANDFDNGTLKIFKEKYESSFLQNEPNVL